MQNAFESYEESYNIQNQGLSFLMLIIALEVLFGPKDGMVELTHRISRNIAVLLGENLEDSKRIFKEIKNFYNKRSKMLHTGEYRYKHFHNQQHKHSQHKDIQQKCISQDDLLKLREYVRKSIKKIYSLNKDKETLEDLLNFKGFDISL